jgi:UDP-N-acetylmuramoylalanine--D-glutamate ligase
MPDLANKQVLVVGLDEDGVALAEFLIQAGCRVTAIDREDSEDRRVRARPLQASGVSVQLGAKSIPDVPLDFAAISPQVRRGDPLLRTLAEREVARIGPLELAGQLSRCLTIAVGGTNGKSTTIELVTRLLAYNHRKTFSPGLEPWPLTSVADQSKDADFLLLQADAFELERTRHFRPSVAVLLNVAPDYLDRFSHPDDYVRAQAGLFRNQQAFDWAVVQSEALARMKAMDLVPPSKVVTFSASDPEADLYLDRGLIISRIPNWTGPLLDTAQCRLRGGHHAEDFMAALAVGRALRLPLEAMVETLKQQPPRPHRFEPVAEFQGVEYIDDAKASNVTALRHAVLAARPGPGAGPNIWLLAGGRDKGLDFHEAGPEISRRVKRAFLFDSGREKIRAAWSLFTPCTLSNSLLEAITEAAKNATAGDVVLLSPACSSFDQFRNYQQCGEKFCQAVNQLVGVPGPATPT